MSVSRREFLLLGLGTAGLLAAGCASQEEWAGERPDPIWNGVGGGRDSTVRLWSPRGVDGPYTPGGTPGNPGGQGTGNPGTGGVTPRAGTINGPLKAIPRSSWATESPIAGRLLLMNGVERITVHHEGWTEVSFSDAASTMRRLDSIRASHLERLKAADIGYHYVIDRAGRLWQGRDVAYQGAHVRDHNAHNVGVMCLGNFDIQSPTEAQLATLRPTLITLQQSYKVPVKFVYTHQELNPTECPGTALQRHMVNIRRAGLA
jgi:hypothetical protein